MPQWAWQTALASGPLLVAIPLTLLQRPLHHMCSMPQRAYWTLLVPGCVAAAAAQWLAEHRLSSYFGMSAGLAQAARPLLVAQLGVAIGGQAAPAAFDVAAMAALALLGCLPLLPLLRLASTCVLGAQLACSALAPVLLQALMQQDAAGAGALPLLVHVRGWRLVSVQLHLLVSIGGAAPWTHLNLPWLLIHSFVAVAQEYLGLLLIRDTGAVAFELFGALACIPYPAIWGMVMSYTPLAYGANLLALTGSVTCLAALAAQRYVAAGDGSGSGGGGSGFGSKGNLRLDIPAYTLLGTLSRSTSTHIKQCSPELIA